MANRWESLQRCGETSIYSLKLDTCPSTPSKLRLDWKPELPSRLNNQRQSSLVQQCGKRGSGTPLFFKLTVVYMEGGKDKQFLLIYNMFIQKFTVSNQTIGLMSVPRNSLPASPDLFQEQTQSFLDTQRSPPKHSQMKFQRNLSSS